jgi:hypothetical protein
MGQITGSEIVRERKKTNAVAVIATAAMRVAGVPGIAIDVTPVSVIEAVNVRRIGSDVPVKGRQVGAILQAVLGIGTARLSILAHVTDETKVSIGTADLEHMQTQFMRMTTQVPASNGLRLSRMFVESSAHHRRCVLWFLRFVAWNRLH